MRLIWIALVLCLSACAQVPKESVELSTTVGRDVTTVYKSHREIAKLLFGRMRQDINYFVDNIYAPYQIRSVMSNDFKNARSSKEADKRSSILLAINNAFKPEASDETQREVFEAMGVMVSLIRQDIESKRQELLKPINEQEKLVLSSIDRNYAQIIYGNSIVTGYLAGVVKVNDAQNKVLNEIGLDGDLNAVVGKRLAVVSEEVANIVQKAEKTEATITSIETALKDLKRVVTEN